MEKENRFAATIALAKAADFDFFYAIRCEESNIFWTGHAAPPDYDNLKTFFLRVIDGQKEPLKRKINTIWLGSTRIGYLYFNPSAENEEEFELAPGIAERYWGHGYATEAIRCGLEQGKKLGFKRMVTAIREDNAASLRAFQACGAKKTDLYKLVYIPKLGREIKMYRVEKEL